MSRRLARAVVAPRFEALGYLAALILYGLSVVARPGQLGDDRK